MLELNQSMLNEVVGGSDWAWCVCLDRMGRQVGGNVMMSEKTCAKACDRRCAPLTGWCM